MSKFRAALKRESLELTERSELGVNAKSEPRGYA